MEIVASEDVCASAAFFLLFSCVISCLSNRRVLLAVEELMEDCVSEIGTLTVL